MLCSSFHRLAQSVVIWVQVSGWQQSIIGDIIRESYPVFHHKLQRSLQTDFSLSFYTFILWTGHRRGLDSPWSFLPTIYLLYRLDRMALLYEGRHISGCEPPFICRILSLLSERGPPPPSLLLLRALCSSRLTLLTLSASSPAVLLWSPPEPQPNNFVFS